MFAEPTTPSSPTILLSPSTPEFAPVSLPQESETDHEEEIFIGEGVQDSVSGSGEGANGMTASDKSGVGQEGRVDKKLRQSLMLLDTRLAELESMGFDKPAQSLNRSPTLVEAIISEEDTQGQGSDFDAVNVSFGFFANVRFRFCEILTLSCRGNAVHARSRFIFRGIQATGHLYQISRISRLRLLDPQFFGGRLRYRRLSLDRSAHPHVQLRPGTL